MSAHLTDRAALCALGWDRPDGATLRRRSAGSAGGPEAEGQRHGALVLQDLCRGLWEPMPRRMRCRRGTWPSAAPPHSRTVENSFARTKISPGLCGVAATGSPCCICSSQLVQFTHWALRMFIAACSFF